MRFEIVFLVSRFRGWIEGRENGNIVLRHCWYHRKLRVLIVRNGRVIYGYLSLTSIDVARTIFITLLPTFLINPPFCSPKYRTFTRNICPFWSKNPHTLPTQTQCTCYNVTCYTFFVQGLSLNFIITVMNKIQEDFIKTTVLDSWLHSTGAISTILRQCLYN